MNIIFTQEELEYMWKKLVDSGHKKAVALNNSYRNEKLEDPVDVDEWENFNAYRYLNDALKRQVANEFFKTCDVSDITIVLINKGFNVQQINQILKAKEEKKDLNKYLDTTITSEKLRQMRQNDIER